METKYRVTGLDRDGYEVSGGSCWDTLRDARRAATCLVSEEEAIDAGMIKVEIRNRLSECIADYFVN